MRQPVLLAARLLAVPAGGAVLAAALMSALLAPRALAADEAPLLLPRATAAAVTADLDGDGSRELIRIAEAVPSRIDPAFDLAVEVWGYGRGGWSMTGLTGLVRPSDDPATWVSVDVVTDGFGLLVWHEAGLERAVVVTAVGPSRSNGSTSSVCCLALLDVAVGPGGVSLRELASADGDVESVIALDMDADGTDEIVVTHPSDSGTGRQVTVLRWDGVSFGPERFEIGGSDHGGVPIVGDTDGSPGDEAIFGPMDDGSLARLGAEEDGRLYREAAAWNPRQPRGYPWIAGAGNGLFFAQLPGALTTWRWPRGGEPSLEARLELGASSGAGVLTAGDEVAIVETEGGLLIGGRGATVTRVHRPEGTALELRSTPAAAELTQLSRSEFEALMQFDFGIYPYVGPIAGGLGDGRAAYVSMGNLVTLTASGKMNAEPIAALVGAFPLASAGPAGSWMVLGRGWVSGGSPVYLFAGGGFFGSKLSLVPTADALQVERGGVVQLVPSSSVRGTWTDDSTQRTFVPDGGLHVTVTGPAGSSVIALVDGSIVLEATLGAEALDVTLRPATTTEANQAYAGLLLVVTPSGQAYLDRWDLVILRERPALSVAGETLIGDLAASVRGRASEHATVLVDGKPVELDANGGFNVRVDASPWPRDVPVVARDAVGNETAAVVSVVGLYDYRGLPWVLIVAVVTVLAGLVLFVRMPHAARAPVPTDEESGLEDLNADEPLASTKTEAG